MGQVVQLRKREPAKAPSNEKSKVGGAGGGGETKRRYLTEREVERLLDAARKSGRYETIIIVTAIVLWFAQG